eukprot:IDg21820t1
MKQACALNALAFFCTLCGGVRTVCDVFNVGARVQSAPRGACPTTSTAAAIAAAAVVSAAASVAAAAAAATPAAAARAMTSARVCVCAAAPAAGGARARGKRGSSVSPCTQWALRNERADVSAARKRALRRLESGVRRCGGMGHRGDTIRGRADLAAVPRGALCAAVSHAAATDDGRRDVIRRAHTAV